MDGRVPTFAFTVDGHTPRAVAERLAEQEIAVWDGDYYAVEVMQRLGLAPDGAVRAGFIHYNTAAEVDRLLTALARAVKLLVLGGTEFLGRHTVEAALARGDEVTIFTRGRTNPELFPEAEHLVGDRDGGLDALSGAHVGRRRRHERLRAARAAHVGRAAAGRGRPLRVRLEHLGLQRLQPPVDEDSAVAALDDPFSESVEADYGALKAACEHVVEEVYGERGASVRAGLLVGPHDPTDRFTYWPRRLAEGGDVLAPGDPAAPVQLVDARDLGAWLVELAEHGPGGVFNATGPALPLTLGELLERAIAAVGSDARLVWTDEQRILDADVQPWMELPLWVPGDDWAGFQRADIGRALAAGLRFRPVEETVRDTLAWSREAGQQRPTLTREKERAILAGA